MENTLENLKSYLQRSYGFDASNITRETSLLNDLEIKGDDVDEFLSRIAEDFSIDVKRLNLSGFYLGTEPFDILSPIVWLLKKEKANRKPTILIGDIEKFIDTGILE
jgi:hypothetical protein